MLSSSLIGPHTDLALEKFGINEQDRMAMEEAAELIHAINKVHRNPSKENIDHLAEEIAGVYITLDQLETYYGLRGEIMLHLVSQNNKLAKYLEEV